MATPIRQQIKDLVKEQLLTITTDNGYEQDVEDVRTDQIAQLQVKSYPAICIIDRGDQDRRLVQGIYEGRMLLELRAVLEDMDRSTRETDVAKLAADAQKAIMARETWDGRAVQTMIQSADVHASDAMDHYGMMFLLVEILYRTQENDPYRVALI